MATFKIRECPEYVSLADGSYGAIRILVIRDPERRISLSSHFGTERSGEFFSVCGDEAIAYAVGVLESVAKMERTTETLGNRT